MSTVHEQTTSISTGLLIRVIVLLIAVWSLLAGLALTAFHGSSASALGAGVADESGQRLAGAHMLILVPLYLLIAWKPRRYGTLLWLPFFAQFAVVLAVGYSIFDGDTDFADGVLAVVISGMLAGTLAFVWITQQRSSAQVRYEDEEAEAPDSDSQAWEA